MQILDLRPGLHALGHVQVHLVAVEIGVVRRRAGQVHPEGGPGQHLHPVSHHTHLVQRRLTIENYQVAVADVPLHPAKNRR